MAQGTELFLMVQNSTRWVINNAINLNDVKNLILKRSDQRDLVLKAN